MSLHDRIRDARHQAGYSVNAFAKKMGVSSTAAWNWDCENTTPTADKLPKIAQVLGVDLGYLTGDGKGPAMPHTASAPTTQPPRETVDAILNDAASRIAALLGVKANRIGVEFHHLKG